MKFTFMFVLVLVLILHNFYIGTVYCITQCVNACVCTDLLNFKIFKQFVEIPFSVTGSLLFISRNKIKLMLIWLL